MLASDLARRRELIRDLRAAEPAHIPTQTGTLMDIDGGHGGGLEHSRHAPGGSGAAPPPPSSPPALPALPALTDAARFPGEGDHGVTALLTESTVQVPWSGVLIPDSGRVIEDSQPGFPSSFVAAVASAVASVAGSRVGSPTPSVVDDDGDETMGENAASRENPTHL